MNELEAAILEICRTAMSAPDLQPDQDLTAAGADSLTAVEIVTRIEEQFGQDVVETYFETPTVQALAAAIRPAGQPVTP